MLESSFLFKLLKKKHANGLTLTFFNHVISLFNRASAVGSDAELMHA